MCGAECAGRQLSEYRAPQTTQTHTRGREQGAGARSTSPCLGVSMYLATTECACGLDAQGSRAGGARGASSSFRYLMCAGPTVHGQGAMAACAVRASRCLNVSGGGHGRSARSCVCGAQCPSPFCASPSARPCPPSARPPERPNMVFLAKSKKNTNSDARLGPALASPSTLNTPLHTLNCTAFASASAADNILPTGPGPRAV